MTELKEKLQRSCELAKANLVQDQGRMKYWYDKKARLLQYEVRDQLLAILQILAHPLQARYTGSYRITKPEVPPTVLLP